MCHLFVADDPRSTELRPCQRVLRMAQPGMDFTKNRGLRPDAGVDSHPCLTKGIDHALEQGRPCVHLGDLAESQVATVAAEDECVATSSGEGVLQEAVDLLIVVFPCAGSAGANPNDNRTGAVGPPTTLPQQPLGLLGSRREDQLVDHRPHALTPAKRQDTSSDLRPDALEESLIVLGETSCPETGDRTTRRGGTERNPQSVQREAVDEAEDVILPDLRLTGTGEMLLTEAFSDGHRRVRLVRLRVIGHHLDDAHVCLHSDGALVRHVGQTSLQRAPGVLRKIVEELRGSGLHLQPIERLRLHQTTGQQASHLGCKAHVGVHKGIFTTRIEREDPQHLLTGRHDRDSHHRLERRLPQLRVGLEPRVVLRGRGDHHRLTHQGGPTGDPLAQPQPDLADVPPLDALGGHAKHQLLIVAVPQIDERTVSPSGPRRELHGPLREFQGMPAATDQGRELSERRRAPFRGRQSQAQRRDIVARKSAVRRRTLRWSHTPGLYRQVALVQHHSAVRCTRDTVRSPTGSPGRGTAGSPSCASRRSGR